MDEKNIMQTAKTKEAGVTITVSDKMYFKMKKKLLVIR